MMLKFMRTPNIQRLSNLIEGAKGNLYIQLSEEKYFDLKESTNITKDLEDVLHQSKDIVMHISDTRDYFDFANFMVGTTYNESASIQSMQLRRRNL